MSLTNLFEEMRTKNTRSIPEMASNEGIDNMMGFSPIPTVIRNVEGAPDKEFRVGKMI